MSKKAFVPVFVRSENNYDMLEASKDSAFVNQDPSMAKQSFAEEVDINTIVRRFGLDGKLPENVRAPVYADFDQVWDFHSAMNSLVTAETAFMQLPAKVRERFANDPGKFVEFCSTEGNEEELRKLGLIPPAPPARQEPAAASAAADPSPKPAGSSK